MQYVRLLVALVLCGPAYAASDLTGPTGGGGPGFGVVGMVGSASAPPPSYTGPGDIVSGATAWYGLRAYTAAIAAAATQKLINIRNTATSETCDVIVATNGGFGNVANCSGSSSGDTVAVFCALSGGPCAITEFYDQSGNGSNATQATAGDQPALTLSCINSLPCVVFNGTSDFLATAAALALSTTATISTVAERTGSFTSNMSIMGESTQSNIAGFSSSANTVFVCQNCSFVTATAADSVWHALQFVATGTTGTFINVDGVPGSTGNPGSGSWGAVAMQIGRGNGNLLKGNMTEVGIWSANFSSGNNTAVCQNQQAYYGAGNFGAAC